MPCLLRVLTLIPRPLPFPSRADLSFIRFELGGNGASFFLWRERIANIRDENDPSFDGGGILDVENGRGRERDRHDWHSATRSPPPPLPIQQHPRNSVLHTLGDRSIMDGARRSWMESRTELELLLSLDSLLPSPSRIIYPSLVTRDKVNPGV